MHYLEGGVQGDDQEIGYKTDPRNKLQKGSVEIVDFLRVLCGQVSEASHLYKLQFHSKLKYEKKTSS